MRTIGAILGLVLLLAAMPALAGTTIIDFSQGIGLLTGQSPSGGLYASAGRAVFSSSCTAFLKQNGSYLTGYGTVSATMGMLCPYSDAQYGVGLVMYDPWEQNTLSAIVDGDGMVVLSDWIGNQRALQFSYPAASNNSMTLTYNTYSEQATLTLNGSSSVSLDAALNGASGVYVGVFSYGPGGFGAFSASGSGLPDYPVVPANTVRAEPSGFVEEGMALLLSAPQGSAYHWKKNGTALTGKTSQSMTIDPVVPEDAGSYTCAYTNIISQSTETVPYVLVVYEPNSIPVTGRAGAAFLAVVVAIIGIACIRFRVKRAAG